MSSDNKVEDVTYKGKKYSKGKLKILIEKYFDDKYGISKQLNSRNDAIREYVEDVNADCAYCITKDPEVLDALFNDPDLKMAIDGILYRERELAKSIDGDFAAYRDIKARKGAFDAYLARQKQITIDGNFGEINLTKFLDNLDKSDLAPFGLENLNEDEEFNQ